jgi:hypothetical protein
MHPWRYKPQDRGVRFWLTFRQSARCPAFFASVIIRLMGVTLKQDLACIRASDNFRQKQIGAAGADSCVPVLLLYAQSLSL